jgi:hypothetical protein
MTAFRSYREIRLLETLENVCDRMKSYVSRARRKFPYVKGSKCPINVTNYILWYYIDDKIAKPDRCNSVIYFNKYNNDSLKENNMAARCLNKKTNTNRSLQRAKWIWPQSTKENKNTRIFFSIPKIAHVIYSLIFVKFKIFIATFKRFRCSLLFHTLLSCNFILLIS